MNNEPAAGSGNTPAERLPKKKKRRILRRILLSLLAVTVLAMLGGYAYWVIRGSRLDLPYGLKAGMNAEQAKEVLQENGFRGGEPTRPGEFRYAPYEVYGVPARDVTLRVRDGTTGDGKQRDIRLEFSFADSAVKSGGKEGEEARDPGFERILAECKARYGSPSENLIRGYPFYDWSGIRMNLDFYTVSLYYFDEGKFALNYTWSKSNLF